MIIKIIPENDMEKRRVKEVEHKGVKEFFIFGSKKDEDKDLVDFHDWSGGYRYLIGSLAYFVDVIKTEMNSKSKANSTEISLRPDVVNNAMPPQKPLQFMKQGAPNEQHVDQVIMAEDMKDPVAFPPPPVTPSIVDVERDEEVKVDDDDNDEAGQ